MGNATTEREAHRLRADQCVIAQGSQELVLGQVIDASPEDLDAGEAGHCVGYDDPLHLSPGYKRHFGAPPMRDAERLRELATAGCFR